MAEINFAENDQRIMNNPTDADCRRLGSTHFAYGWARTPWGHWPDDKKALYFEGYDEPKKNVGRA